MAIFRAMYSIVIIYLTLNGSWLSFSAILLSNQCLFMALCFYHLEWITKKEMG